MNQEIIDGNKLIAEFMQHEEGYDEHGTWQRLKYRTSWDWLMPVVDKISHIEFDRHEQELPFSETGETEIVIETHYPRTFGMLNKEGKPMFRFNCSMLHTADTLIEAAWAAVVDFIQWYNQQKQLP